MLIKPRIYVSQDH